MLFSEESAIATASRAHTQMLAPLEALVAQMPPSYCSGAPCPSHRS
jgi:hypothetical protein